MDLLVSIIIPVYNCEAYIQECVEKLVEQTYSKIEIILVDDGSKDQSADRCLELVERYANVRYFYQDNSGPSVARNKGLENANGEYVMFVDADDFVKSNIVEVLLNVMNDETDIVCCSYELLETGATEKMFDEDFVAASLCEKEPIFIQLMDVTYGHSSKNATAIGVPWAKLFRKSLFDKYGIRFDSSLRRMQDNALIMQAVYYARRIVYVNQYLYRYRVDHINTYKSVSYSPDVYLGVLNNRSDFYRLHPDIMTKQIKDYFYLEHVNYLMMSIHYIVASNIQDKVGNIKKLCNNKQYVDMLGKKSNAVTSRKQKLQCFMYRHKLYSLLFVAYKIKYKL